MQSILTEEDVFAYGCQACPAIISHPGLCSLCAAERRRCRTGGQTRVPTREITVPEAMRAVKAMSGARLMRNGE